MSAADFSTIKRRATANPRGPEALRLRWLEARVLEAPREALLELVRQCRESRFAIDEIDDYVQEQLAIARTRLDRARERRSLAPRTFRSFERAVENAEAADRQRPHRAFSALLGRALDIAAELGDDGSERGGA